MRLKPFGVIVAVISASAVFFPLNASIAATSSTAACPSSTSSWPSLVVGTSLGSKHPEVTLIAPHGNFDKNTKNLTVGVAQRTGANVVWATDTKATYARRINVNRPTETRYGMERKSSTAASVFELFSTCVKLYPSKLNIEIHGDSSQEAIEIATVNVTYDEAVAMKNAWAGRLGREVLIDAAGDKLTMAAGANKRTGLMSQCVVPCLHIELPGSLRTDDALSTTSPELANFIDGLGHIVD